MMANGNVEHEEEEGLNEQRRSKKTRSYSVDVKKREAAMETVLPVVADSYRDIIKMVTFTIVSIMNMRCIVSLNAIYLPKCDPSRALKIHFAVSYYLSRYTNPTRSEKTLTGRGC